jgi:hypothetical protein
MSEEPTPISPDRMAAFRLTRHHLASRAPASDLVQVARDMGGAQAQVLSAAELSLWARTRGLHASDVEAALWEDRTLVRVWCMRGTVHLVPARDFAVFVRGCAGRAERDARWMARRGLPRDLIERMVEQVTRVFDLPLTRNEAAARLRGSLGMSKKIRLGRGWGKEADVDAFEVDGHTVSLGGILGYARIRGNLCAGPPRGNQGTLVRPDAWLRDWQGLSVPEAEDELLRVYLRANGPANVSDFAWWTYVTASAARAIWDRHEEDLAPVAVGGRTAWVLRDDLPALRRARVRRPAVRLLPSFDAFLLGHKDKGHLVEAKRYKRVYRPQGWLSPAVLVDGRIAGTWSHERKGRRIALRVEPFHRFGADIREAIEREGQDLGRFLEADEASLTFASEP